MSAPHPLIAPGPAVERLPMLRVVLENIAASLSRGARRAAASTVAFVVEGVGAGEVGALLDALEDNAVAGLLKVPQWQASLAVCLDRTGAFALTEAVFGGDGAEPAYEEPRAFSGIELRLARTLMEQAGDALAAAFAPIRTCAVHLEKLETRMEFVDLGRRAQPAVTLALRLEALGRVGRLCFILPMSALISMRQSLAQSPAAASQPADAGWSRGFGAQVERADVRLRAVLRESGMTLAQVAALEIGAVLPLAATVNTLLTLETGDRPLFVARLGKGEGHFSVRVEGTADAA